MNTVKANIKNPKVWVLVIGVTVAVGMVAAAETRRRKAKFKEDFGAFVQRFLILPFPQPPPPAAKQTLAGLTFAINDIFELEDYVTGFGNPDWARTHEAAEKTAVTVTALLKNGAVCVGQTVMGELGFGVSGENMHYGTPINPEMPAHVPGGSSSGSAVAVAAGLVDFALGTDTIGCIRIPAAFCGLLSYRPSHGAVSTIGVLPNSQSLDTVGWLARDPSILLRVGHTVLKLNTVEPRRGRHLIFADDLFQLSKVPKQKAEGVISKAFENLSGYQPQQHINFGQHISLNVPSLKGFRDQSTKLQNGISNLKALCSAMVSLQRHEFKTNHEDWVKSVEPKLASDVSDNVLTAINTTHENIKALYDIRKELRACMQILLKDNGILVIPTIADPPSKLNSNKRDTVESHNRALILSSIASMSGCCQVTIPLGKNDGCPISVSFITFHGGDKFLLDTVLDMYSSLKEQINFVSNPAPLQDANENFDTSEILKEKGNAAYKGKQWNKAVNYYSEAIKLNGKKATYYSNRAEAYLQLGWYDSVLDLCFTLIFLY
ncbi:outer envelope protein 64 [Populus alba x Populus x berolinensis]|uniref:Outer envelope protein 64 n=1 Tax=Populus alba x Populus x berolinensis TaxID=444605 RepID=A0AAD6RNN3_9ROSI|nr:outer envelope protein 64 [Populus alba x Populus x berolinensis]